MADLLSDKELNDAILYRLECIAGFSMNIQKAMQNGLDLSDRFSDVERVDRMFADLSDIADEYTENKNGKTSN